jgi:phosphinothricin acetyltransferase
MQAWRDGLVACNFPVIVASEPGAGSILGYGAYSAFRSGQGYSHTVEHSVYVSRSARRRGTAHLLMRHLIAHAQAQGLHRMIGAISADQVASIALHRSLGFQFCGQLPEVGIKNGQPLDLALMVLALDRLPPG